MKKRNGFVSNSSSSSFVFLGFEIDSSKITLDFLKEHAGFTEENIEDYSIVSCCGCELSRYGIDDVNFCPKCGKAKSEMKVEIDIESTLADFLFDIELPNELSILEWDECMYFGTHLSDEGVSYKDLITKRAIFIPWVNVFENNVEDRDAWLIDNLQIINGESSY
jgi:hypothetical protein